MSSHEYQVQISNLIQQETDLYTRLLGTLNDENQALCNNDFETVHTLTSTKQQIVDTLSSLAQQRESLLQQAGFSKNKSGITAFIKASGGLLERAWQALMTKVSECSRQNEINGIMISTASRHTLNALSILRGQQPGDNVRYGSRGEALNIPSSSPLAKA